MDFGSNDIYFFFPFSLFLGVYVYASVCDFVCIALLLPFVLGAVCSFFFLLLEFLALVIIGGFVFLVWLLSSFFLFYFII